MAQMVSMGAMCQCTFGMAPGTLTVTSQPTVFGGGPLAATIMDSTPANITPFGMCQSLANPAVAAATAAAFGVLTPQPCTMVPAGTWIPTNPTVLVGGKPVLKSDCKMMCAFGGSISITNPGQMTVQVK